MTQQQTEMGILRDKLITWFLGIIMTCSIAGITFMLKLVAQIPLIQAQQVQLRGDIGTLQTSVNNVAKDQQVMKEEQARVAEDLKERDFLRTTK